MRQLLLENYLLLALLLFDLSSTATSSNNPGLQTICTDKSPYCKRRSQLCQSNAFRDVMHSLCKRTCNLCGEDDRKSTAMARDENEKEPETGVAESTENEEEEVAGGSVEYPEPETDIEGSEVVTTEPAVTFPTLVTTKTWKRKVCTDSSPDCEGKRHLCSERNYAQLMRNECAKTCGLCSAVDMFSLPKNHRIISNASGSKAGMNAGECRDTASDCRESLCINRSYQQLMYSFCKKTCSLC